MTTLDEALALLEARANRDQLEGMARYGIAVERRLGVRVPDLRQIARQIGKDHDLALALWQTGIDDARILASMIDLPAAVDEAQMDAWAADFNSWDVCDQVCMNLFEKTPFAWDKIGQWSQRQEAFVKRAAYALIACLAWHDKQAADARFVALMPLVKAGAVDDRNYVKKAVSWALRNVGKRNPALHQVALQVAREIGEVDSRSARWIARDVVRDLTGETTQRRLQRMQQ